MKARIQFVARVTKHMAYGEDTFKALVTAEVAENDVLHVLEIEPAGEDARRIADAAWNW
jgi:hypothetical protein